MNYPEKFGFITDLRNCKGKVIEEVELIGMEWSSISRTGWAIRFTDRTRAFVLGGPVTGFIVNPEIEKSYSCEGVETSEIFTPDEYGIMLVDRKRKTERRKVEEQERERRELERLKAKYEGG